MVLSGSLAKVCLTGAAGVAGKHLAALLEREGVECIPVDRRIWALSLEDLQRSLEEALAGAEAVFHFGALVPVPGTQLPSDLALLRANVEPTLLLAAWALRNSRPLVFLSAASIYRCEPTHPALETDPIDPSPRGGFYVLSKYLGEQVVCNHIANGLRASVLRLPSLYGHGMHPNRTVQKFLNLALAGQPIPLHPPVDSSVNLIHAADVARAAWLAATRQAWGVFNVAARVPTTFAELADICVHIAGRGSVAEAPGIAPAASAAPVCFDTSRAAAAFGFEPDIDLATGLRMMRDGRLLP